MVRLLGTFGPGLLHVMFRAYDEAHRQQPELPPALVATRIINAAERGICDLPGLIRAGLSSGRAAGSYARSEPATAGA